MCVPAGSAKDQVLAVFKHFNISVNTSDIFSRCQVRKFSPPPRLPSNPSPPHRNQTSLDYTQPRTQGLIYAHRHPPPPKRGAEVGLHLAKRHHPTTTDNHPTANDTTRQPPDYQPDTTQLPPTTTRLPTTPPNYHRQPSNTRLPTTPPDCQRHHPTTTRPPPNYVALHLGVFFVEIKSSLCPCLGL